MSSTLYGDWDRLRATLVNWSNMNDEFHDAMRDLGEEVSSRIREYIQNQELSFAPLKDEYFRVKVQQGHDPRILIRTGDFVNSIEITRMESSGEDFMVFVGVKGGTTETGISMNELAQYIEYGTRYQPARAPFAQSWEKMKEQIKREVARRILLEVEGEIV